MAAQPIAATSPLAILWTGPGILLASVMIAWGAESAQFFMSQGFALVILAWMQTLPEFAVEAVIAQHQQTSLLIANLTGAIRLLTGLGWPLIYCTAALAHRAKFKKKLNGIALTDHQSVQIVGVLGCLAYVAVICAKGSLTVIDSGVLLLIYAAYIWLIQRLPAEEHESIEDLGKVPHAIVTAPRGIRIFSILFLFGAGGALIFFVADPFLGSLFAISSTLGISPFIFIQWVAPFVSEFPEQVSAFYWARTIDRASMALMNMVSSNITQWTLLAALLPIVLSLARHTPSPIVFDAQQNIELLMTLGQSLLGVVFLINMRLEWWEAMGVFALWAVQFTFSLVAPGPGVLGVLSEHIRDWVTWAYFGWAGLEIARLLLGFRRPQAFLEFAKVWKAHVRRRPV